MKKWIHAADENEWATFDLGGLTCLIFADDAREYEPGYSFISASTYNEKDYKGLTRKQLLRLPEKELDKISDVSILRKLDAEELNPMQKVLLKRANRENFLSKPSEVKDVLLKLRNCSEVFILPSRKNASFSKQLKEQGGELTKRDIKNIVDQLEVKDYSTSTLSFMDYNWNSLLMAFEFKGEYTFQGYPGETNPVTITSLDIYIKIDVDNGTEEGYGALSFHNPEFQMSHPYKDYPPIK